ncbi:YfiR family protein [Ramlibacter sp. WS9]|uniref:YfiR family protein n=1 Tax=Ramlibacter sp. WS9 TaxID=1882741 RepID=UPI0011415DEB|nr:YfiR family protein [Ramlibacter sp. WS9]ROZ66712.1 YfiR family protein [Ramlibacter sp. WS9]
MHSWLYRMLRPAPFLRRCACALGAAVLLLAAGGAMAQPALERASEALVKAAFLHKFASFVEWPPGQFEKADSPLKIGILGNDAIWQDLSELAKDRDRDGRPVVVTRLKDGDPLTGYHILYIKTTAARMTELLQQVPEGVLTIADSDGAHPLGSVISFFVETGNVRFGISVDSATRQKLRLSPRLLAVARNVQGSLPAAERLAYLRRVPQF